MEFTNAQIRDFAGSDEQYEKAKRLVDEQRIVSLDIDDFSSREIIMINATNGARTFMQLSAAWERYIVL